MIDKSAHSEYDAFEKLTFIDLSLLRVIGAIL